MPCRVGGPGKPVGTAAAALQGPEEGTLAGATAHSPQEGEWVDFACSGCVQQGEV